MKRALTYKALLADASYAAVEECLQIGRQAAALGARRFAIGWPRSQAARL